MLLINIIFSLNWEVWPEVKLLTSISLNLALYNSQIGPKRWKNMVFKSLE